MNFFALRYFVIQSSQMLFSLEENTKPKDYFIFPLINKEEIVYYNRKYTTRILNDNIHERYLVGYLLKSRETHFIELKKDLFTESDIPNWEKLFFFLDTEKQIIVFEYNTTIANPDNIRNVLFQLTSKSVKKIGYELKIEFLVDKFAFWNIITKSTGIYQIAFELNAPNLFGGSKKADDWLKKLKEIHNMTKVSFDFRNENAELNYEKEELESYRDYADSGGGNWTLGIIQNGHKKKYKSANNLRKKEAELNTDNPKEIKKNIEEIIYLLIKLENSLDENKE